jgi:hypothetical protein
MLSAVAAASAYPGDGGVEAAAAAAAAALGVLEAVVWATRLSGSRRLGSQVAAALAGDGALMTVLVDGFIATPEVDYQCRVRAVRVVRQLADLMGWLAVHRAPPPAAALAAAAVSPLEPASPPLHQPPPWPPAASPLLFLPGSQSLTRRSPSQAAVKPLIKRVAAPRYHAKATLVGKQLLREGLLCLRALVAAVPAPLWQPFWCGEGGSYWLTRLLRDHEGEVRAAAHALLAAAAANHAPAARAWLQV